jgi:hypothetical protein
MLVRIILFSTILLKMALRKKSKDPLPVIPMELSVIPVETGIQYFRIFTVLSGLPPARE